MLKDHKKLLPKQRRFLAYYLQTGDKAEASIRAGYLSKKASKAQHMTNATRLLKDATIAKAVEEHEGVSAIEQDLLDMESEGIDRKVLILTELSTIAFGKQVREKTADRLRAIEMLGKYYKMFTDKVEHSGGMSLSFNIIRPNRTEKPVEETGDTDGV